MKDLYEVNNFMPIFFRGLIAYCSLLFKNCFLKHFNNIFITFIYLQVLYIQACFYYTNIGASCVEHFFAYIYSVLLYCKGGDCVNNRNMLLVLLCVVCWVWLNLRKYNCYNFPTHAQNKTICGETESIKKIVHVLENYSNYNRECTEWHT
jgi:hypothetical protein